MAILVLATGHKATLFRGPKIGLVMLLFSLETAISAGPESFPALWWAEEKALVHTWACAPPGDHRNQCTALPPVNRGQSHFSSLHSWLSTAFLCHSSQQWALVCIPLLSKPLLPRAGLGNSASCLNSWGIQAQNSSPEKPTIFFCLCSSPSS